MGVNLVLGSAVGYVREQVAPFLISLRNAGYSGSVVLFVDRRLERALEQDPVVPGVTLVRVLPWLPMKFRFFDNARRMRILWSPVQRLMWPILAVLRRLPVGQRLRLRLELAVVAVVCTPMEARFLRCLRYLVEHPHDRILLSDVRDVVFQEDPFGQMPAAGLALSVETDRYTIATESHNAAWLARAYGPEMVTRIGANRACNVGVTYGDRDAMTLYLEQMAYELLRIPPWVAGIGGTDTATHNMLAWTGRIGSFEQLHTLTSPVATLNGVDERDLKLDPDGRLLNLDGSRPSVVHQYDRQLAVRDTLLRALAS